MRHQDNIVGVKSTDGSASLNAFPKGKMGCAR